MTTKGKMCIKHHDACKCRERRFKEMEETLKDLVEWNETEEVSGAFTLAALHYPVSEKFSKKAGKIWSKARKLAKEGRC